MKIQKRYVAVVLVSVLLLVIGIRIEDEKAKFIACWGFAIVLVALVSKTVPSAE